MVPTQFQLGIICIASVTELCKTKEALIPIQLRVPEEMKAKAQKTIIAKEWTVVRELILSIHINF